MGQIANQMAVELLCRLREKLRQRRKKKEKGRAKLESASLLLRFPFAGLSSNPLRSFSAFPSPG